MTDQAYEYAVYEIYNAELVFTKAQIKRIEGIVNHANMSFRNIDQILDEIRYALDLYLSAFAPDNGIVCYRGGHHVAVAINGKRVALFQKA